MQLLDKYTSKQELLNAVSTVDAAIIRSDKFDAEVIKAAKNLKIVIRAGAGYDNVDLKMATENNIVVMNTPGQNANAVAELAIGMNVIVYTRYSKHAAAAIGLKVTNSLEQLYEKSDVISIHVPVKGEHIKSVSYEVLKHLKDGSIIVNAVLYRGALFWE